MKISKAVREECGGELPGFWPKVVLEWAFKECLPFYNLSLEKDVTEMYSRTTSDRERDYLRGQIALLTVAATSTPST